MIKLLMNSILFIKIPQSIKKFISLYQIKLILFFFTISYGFVLIIILLLLFKKYKMGIIYYDNTVLPVLKQDIFLLIKDNKFNQLSSTYYTNSMINKMYLIHDIDHYRTFLYFKNNEMSILHKILESNHEINSKFRSMILQNMLSIHFEGLTEIMMENFKLSFVLSVPLLISFLCLMSVNGYELISPMII